jgi:hypothetical protein
MHRVFCMPDEARTIPHFCGGIAVPSSTKMKMPDASQLEALSTPYSKADAETPTAATGGGTSQEPERPDNQGDRTPSLANDHARPGALRRRDATPQRTPAFAAATPGLTDEELAGAPTTSADRSGLFFVTFRFLWWVGSQDRANQVFPSSYFLEVPSLSAQLHLPLANQKQRHHRWGAAECQHKNRSNSTRAVPEWADKDNDPSLRILPQPSWRHAGMPCNARGGRRVSYLRVVSRWGAVPVRPKSNRVAKAIECEPDDGGEKYATARA